MQWTVLVLSSAMLVTARSRTESSEEIGVEPYGSRDVYEIKNRQMWNPRYQKDVYEILSRLDEKAEAGDAKIPRKRALSALSRWKPLGNLGVKIKSMHRVPARAPMMSMVPEMNLVSAESSEGVRPLGQPLRWGRKR